MSLLLEPTELGITTALHFRSPTRTITAATPLTALRPGRGDDPATAERVAAVLSPGEVAVAGLPFEPDGPVVVHPVPADGTPAAPRPALPGPRRDLPPPAIEDFRAAVVAALPRLADPADPLHKVVLGRWLELPWPADPAATLRALLATAAPYVFRLPGPTGSELLGASPELLLRRQGSSVVSHPLAGSVPRADDPDEDAERAAGLLDSTKDRAEHDYVVRDIAARLRPWCTELDVPAGPSLLSTDTMWHLGTPVRGVLQVHAPSALALAQVLHPTPAVGGFPRQEARDLIGRLEPRPRGVMTGAVGWVDAHGDGEFAVTIRSALLHRDRVELFAGAGIVAGSDPDAEVAETTAKLGTMLRALVAR